MEKLYALSRSAIQRDMYTQEERSALLFFTIFFELWNEEVLKILMYTYWKLAEPWQFKQLQNSAPQALIDDVNIWAATWLYRIVLSENLASWILDHWSSRLDPCISRLCPLISKLEALELRDARIEFRASSVNLLLSSTVNARKIIAVKDATYAVVEKKSLKYWGLFTFLSQVYYKSI